MIDQASVPSLMGSTVRDSAGEKIGKVGQVYLDDTTGQPEWVTVRTGLFGTKESFIPLAAARVEGDELVVDIAKSKVHDAPRIDEDGHLSEEQETELYTYYGVSQGPFGRQPAAASGPATGAPDLAAPSSDIDSGGLDSGGLDSGGVASGGSGGLDSGGGERGGIESRPAYDADAERAVTAGAADPVVTGGAVDPTVAGGTTGGTTGGTAGGTTGGTDERAAGADEPDAARRRLRRWLVTDERSTTPVVDESGTVIGEVSAEQVDVRPADEAADQPQDRPRGGDERR